ncbi:hypothetical protein CHU32_08490 [Superficieibacter electus]|uniref:Uncharacterized protein n=1 Tax=Superficieibacter electus TaxID=2022662 RepID=A0A2P5GRF0_9ENTR|nr:hypothetical protein [Superficieibacter electus]POP45836.1 hypothetical protein CHU33_06945 [Superficieibacter electus]POP49142.1 hypothetical protein CHU32_08490 [Superficieibacter electus]
MYKENKKLTDLILGEAVIKILDADAPISFDTLLIELESMLMAESIAERKRAILSAINLVKANLPKTGAATSQRTNCAREIVFFSRFMPTNAPGE